MKTIEQITLPELQATFRSLHLPLDTRMTVVIEDSEKFEKKIRKEKSREAMRKLKGSGNGNLVSVLLEDRKKEALL